MRTIGNIIWFLTCGFVQSLSWFFVGILWCITILGIPIGLQCFKIAGFVIFPFKKQVVYGGSSVSVIGNVLWIVFGGIFLALAALVNGILLCLTIIGIPFGLQCFKFAKLALMPFGTSVEHIYRNPYA